MKLKLLIVLLFSLCNGQLFSQQFSSISLNAMDVSLVSQKVNNIYYGEEIAKNDLTLFNIGSDLYTMQIINYTINNLSISVNTRVEEELPYEVNTYEYNEFYYLDFGCSYNFGNLSFNFSLENILNFNSKDFSIDPNMKTTNGIPNVFYLSHEADALVSLAIAYDF